MVAERRRMDVVIAPNGRRRATVAMGFVRGMLAGLATRGIDCDDLVMGTGIDSSLLRDPDGRIPLEDYAKLYNAIVRRLDDEGFGLFSVPIRFGAFEFLCRSTLSSRTLGEALERSARYLRVVLPDLVISITRTPQEAQIRIVEDRALSATADDPRRVFAFEWLLRLLHGLACWLAARELSLSSVSFPYPRPAHAADYVLIYAARSSFDSNALVATFNPNLLDLPVRRDETALENFLVGAPGKITTLFRRDRQIVYQVRDLLLEALPLSFSLDDAAYQLNLSPRTLHRRLQDEGSSFRVIKDALRRDIALSKLEKSDQSISQIAAELGYSEPSTFFRAFQTWTGMAPTLYRSRLRQRMEH